MSSWIVIAVVFVQALSGCYGVVNDECVKAASSSTFRFHMDWIYTIMQWQGHAATQTKCDVDGGYTDWSSWSKCSQSCGNGIKSRERQCTNPVPKGNGKDCSVIGESTESMACNLKTCDVDGGYTDWSSWSKCSQSCGNGIKSRERQCTNPVQKGNGKYCSVIGESTECMACNLKTCEGTPTYSTAIQKCIKSNNDLRTQHECTEGLVWDVGMAKEAQEYADKLLNDKKGMVHSSTEYGENLYWGAGSSAKTCADANRKWYAEVDNYNYATGTSDGGKIGHFTQMVWKKTQRFGVGIATGPFTFRNGRKGKKTYIVARYSPAGNMQDAYKDNVGKCKAGTDCSASAAKLLTW